MKKLKRVSLLFASLFIFVFSICNSKTANSNTTAFQNGTIDRLISSVADDLDDLIPSEQLFNLNRLPEFSFLSFEPKIQSQFSDSGNSDGLSTFPCYLKIHNLRI